MGTQGKNRQEAGSARQASWRRWFSGQDWERFGQRWKVGETFQAEKKARAKAEIGQGRQGGGQSGHGVTTEGVRGGLGSAQTISSLRPQQSFSLYLQDPCPAPPSAAALP